MAAMEPLCHLVKINSSNFSREEVLLLEAELFTRICEELKEIFRKQNKDYFLLMKFSTEKENKMLENNFIRYIITDILSTGEYNLQGIACYTDTHEDVVQEVIDGRNINPSATLFRRSIDLHRSVRRDLYHSIVKKLLLNI